MNFGWQFWRAQDAFWIRSALLADVVQVSNQKSAAKTRTKIQPNLVEFWMTILAGPGRFLDSACAFLLMLFRLQARNQLPKLAQKFNQIWLNFGWQFWRAQGAFRIRPVHFFAQKSAFSQIWLNFGWQFWRAQDAFWIRPVHFLLVLFSFKPEISLQPNLVEFWVAMLTGPGCFLDSACAFLLMLFRLQARNQLPKLAQKFNQIWLNFGWQFWRVQDAFWIRPARFLLKLRRFQARNQLPKLAEQFNQIWLSFG